MRITSLLYLIVGLLILIALVLIKTAKDDRMEVTIQDDLTNLTNFSVTVEVDETLEGVK